MKIKMIILPITIFAVILLVFALWQYVFTIYEVSIETNTSCLATDGKSTVIIRAVPINAMGIKAPFRKSPLYFEIKEGKDLVKILYNNSKDGEIILQALTDTGKVSVLLKPKFSLEPTNLEITIK